MKNKLRTHSLLISGVVTLLILFLHWYGAFSNIENRSIDLRFRLRQFQEPKAPVMIAAIDNESLETIGKWPWPRKVHAQLVDVCRRAGASMVVYDVIFPDPDRYEPENDRVFAQAIKKSGSVVMGFDFVADDKPVVRTNSKGETTTEVERVVVKEYPVASLAKSAARLGFVNADPDADGYLRWGNLSVQYEPPASDPTEEMAAERESETYYSLNLQAVSLLSGKSPEELIASAPVRDGYSGIGQPIKKVLINWRGDESVYDEHRKSIYQILDPNIPFEWKQEWLKGKIVVVGSIALATFDHYPTAFSPSLPGLYLHVNMLDNLLSNEFIRPIAWPATYALVILLGVAGCLLVLRTNLWIGAASVVSVSGLYWFLAYWMMAKRLLCIELIAPLFSILFNYLAVFFYRFIVEQKEKAGIKKAFGVYVNPHVVDQIAKNPDALKLGGEMREMTVMFSDVAGFTSISEKLTPQELVQLLNIYLTAMTDTIMRFDGTVDKYEGDAIMAFWGAPLLQPQHAKQACLAVLENRERLAELNVELEKKGMNRLAARCGLNTGPMNVGNMGSSQKFNYTVMGDSVNLASRLEGANKQYGTYMMISEATYAQAKDEVEVRELDLLRVKGKKIPIKVFELVCRKGQLTDAQKRGFEIYTEGVELYRGRKFKEALKKFQAVDEFIKEDPPSQTYILRAKDYIEKPPSSEWDGVYVMTTK